MHLSLMAGPGHGRRSGSARKTKGARLAIAGLLATATKLLDLTAPGRQTIHLRAKRARLGHHRLEITLGTSASALTGAPPRW